MGQTRKDRLECDKLEAETAKLIAERRTAEANADRAEFERRDRLAGTHARRVYHFLDSVREASVSKALTTLDVWAQRDPGEPITVIFNSPGGSVIDGLALYDHLLELRAGGIHVTTVARGMAASMGGILLQAGDTRVMGPSAHLLIHEVSKGSIGSVSELEDDLKFAKKLQDRLVDILAERSTLTATQIKRRWKRVDWWLDADEALSFGFIDQIA